MNAYSGLWENEEFDFTHPFVCGRGEENEYITCKKFLKFRSKFGHFAETNWLTN